jgi:hypothetical protein
MTRALVRTIRVVQPTPRVMVSVHPLSQQHPIRPDHAFSLLTRVCGRVIGTFTFWTRVALIFLLLLGVYADSNPNVAGRHTYQFYSADKWKTFKTMDTTNGSSAFEWRFGGKHPVRVIFDPKDTAKYTRSISSGVLVDSAFNLASMDRRIRALEAK